MYYALKVKETRKRLDMQGLPLGYSVVYIKTQGGNYILYLFLTKAKKEEEELNRNFNPRWPPGFTSRGSPQLLRGC